MDTAKRLLVTRSRDIGWINAIREDLLLPSEQLRRVRPGLVQQGRVGALDRQGPAQRLDEGDGKEGALFAAVAAAVVQRCGLAGSAQKAFARFENVV